MAKFIESSLGTLNILLNLDEILSVEEKTNGAAKITFKKSSSEGPYFIVVSDYDEVKTKIEELSK